MDYGQLKQRLGRRRGFDGNEDRLGDFVNDAYLTVCGRRSNWNWLRRVSQFRTRAPETSATAYAWTKGLNSQQFNLADTTGPSGLHKLMEDTFSGSKLKGPEGNMYRIRSRGPLNGDGVGTFYLETPYVGTTTTTNYAAKLYTDEYPLPLACGEIESIIYTGNGQTQHTRSLSLLPQHIHALSVESYESFPSYYSIEQNSQIPTPDSSPTLALGGGVETMAAGYYKYKYRYYNTRTLELGPFSDEASIQLTALDTVSVTWPRHSDYGIAIYRTKVSSTSLGRSEGDAEFFFLAVSTRADMTDVTFVDNTADADLGLTGSSEFFDKDADGNDITGDIVGVLSDARAADGGTTQRIRFWPPPDADYLVEVKYFVVPQEMKLANDVPLVPRQFHPVILDLAESYMLSEEENHGAASAKRSYAMEMINRMERDEEKDPGTRIQIGRGADVETYDGRWPRTVSV